MSSQTVVDVVVSGTTATVVDARVDGVTTVAGAAPVTTVSGQIPDIGVITDFRTENITITSDGFNILSGNLVSTGQFLTDEIAIVSGIAGGQDLTNLSGTVNTLSGNVVATGQYLTSEIAIVSGLAGGQDLTNLSGTVNTLSGNLITTGQTLQVQITSNDGDIQNILTDVYNITNNLITTGQTLTSEIAIVSGLTTGSSSDPALSGKVDTLSGNLITTGQTLLNHVADVNQTLQTQITSNDSDIADLTSNLITTGQTLTSEITIVSGIAENHTDVTALSGKVDGISGNLITTGQTLQTQITSNDGQISTISSNLSTDISNLVTTGQTLTSEIAIVSGIATGGSAEDFAALSGDLITTGQTLQSQITSNAADINTVSSNLISTGSIVDDISGNLVTTGQNLSSDISTNVVNIASNVSNISSLSTNLITTGQTLQAQITSNDLDVSDLTSNLVTTGQTLQTQITSNDGDITNLTSNLITTGQTLTSEIAIVSGLTTGSSSDPALSGKVDTLSGNLITTGQTLQTQITSNDSDITSLTSNLITTGQTLTTDVNTVSGLITDNDADITALKSATGVLKTSTDNNTTNLITTGSVIDDVSGNLITTGQTLQTQITSNDNDISNITSNLVTTGQTLQTQITSNDSDISALTSNLITTGQTLTDEIAIVSGIATGGSEQDFRDLSGNLITTGQTLQAQITSNDSDISTLTSNLVTTGQTLTTNVNTVSSNLISTGAVVDDISGNLITTGQTLQTQITSNDGDITTLTSNLVTTGQTLTTNINTVATNLGTSGQTLQTQITSNDSDISTLTSNLGTTGQTLQTQITSNDSDIASLTTNLGTTGQTLQTQITSNDSDISTLDSTTVKLTTNQSIAGNKIFTNDVTINNLTVTGTEVVVDVENLAVKDNIIEINSGESGAGISRISGGIVIDRGTAANANILYNDANDRFELNFPLAVEGEVVASASNLITTGQTLTTNINTVSTNLGTSGQTLQTQITSNDSDISTLTTNLGTTGQTLQTQITSNDSDITTLTSNLVTTGQTLTTNINTVSTNLISTGKVVDDISGNLITTGQTLQTQITSNDTDITNLSSNLVTTGQTLTTNINTVATNLVTTGQTLTSEIATVSGLIPATVIDGGGTANKVPLWSDANTIGDSVISQSSSKIGIGTATPSAPLHVAVDGTSEILLERTTALAGQISQIRIKSVGSEWSLANNLAGNGKFSIRDVTDSRHVMVFDGDGKVGIGNTAPGEKLEVVGNIFANVSNAGGFMLTASSTSGLVRNNATGVALRTGSSDRLVVDASGVVTTNKLEPLNGNDTGYLGSSSKKWKEVYFGILEADTATFSGALNFNNGSDNCLRIEADAGKDAYINSYGSGNFIQFKQNSAAVLSLYETFLAIPDSTQLRFGGGSDLRFYHDGNNSYIWQVGVGALNIKSSVTDGNIVFTADRGDGGGTFDYFSVNGGDTTYAGGVTTAYTKWPDNSRIALGGGKDLQLYHDGSNSHIKNTGSLYVASETSGDLHLRSDNDATLDVAGIINLDADGAYIYLKDAGTSVGLFKLTSSDFYIKSTVSDKDIIFQGNDGGSTVTALTLDMSDSGTAIFNHDIKLADNGKAIFGGGSDLQIYHSGADSYIVDSGAGDLYIRTSNELRLQDSTGTDNFLYALEGGDVRLYYDGAQKLATASTGVTVTGLLTSTTATFSGNITQTTGDLLYSGGINWDIKHTGASQNIVFSTTPSGGSATERLRITHDGNLSFLNDTSKIKMGLGGDLQIYHDANHSYIEDTGTGALKLKSDDFRVENASSNNLFKGVGSVASLYFNGSEKLATATGGISVTGTGTFSDDIILAGTRAIKNSTSAGVLTLQGGSSWPGGKIVLGGGNAAGGDIKFYTGLSGNDTEKMRITDGGKVGIGTNAPTKLLHVHGSSPQVLVKSSDATDASVKIDAGAAQDSYLVFAQGGSNKWAFIHDYAGTDKLSIYNYANNANRVTFLPDGKVGIGTVTPATPLHVYSTANDVLKIQGADHVRVLIDGTDSSEKSLNFSEAGSLMWKLGMENIAPFEAFVIKNNDNGAPQFVIDYSTGYVGIGVDPDGIGFRVEQSINGNWAGLIKNTHATNGHGLKVQAGDDSAVTSFRVANVSNTTLLEVLGDGNVGIGTATSINSKLKVEASADGDKLSLENTTTGGKAFWTWVTGASNGVTQQMYDNTNTLKVFIRSYGDSYFNGGNVGIGTASPNADLEVSTTSGGELLVTRSGNSGVTLQQVNGGATTSGSLAIKAGTAISFSTNGTNQGLYINNQTYPRVGIGTSSFRSIGGLNPQLLNIEGVNSQWDSGLAIVSNAAGQYEAACLVLGRTGGTTAGSNTIVADNNVIGRLIFTAADGVDMRVTPAEIRSSVDDSSPAADSIKGDLEFYTNDGSSVAPISRLIITPTGNVGIGTTNPTFAAVSGNTVKGLNIQNVGQDTQASLRLTGHNASGNPGVATYTELLHAGANLRFDINHNGTVRFSIAPAGAITFNSAFTFPTADGSAGQVLQTNGSGTVTWASVTGGGGVSGSGTDNYIPRWNGTTALQDSSIVALDSGIVGIGTNAPNAAGASTNNSILSLKGKATAYGGILELINYGTSGNGQSHGVIRFLDNTTENAQIEVLRHSAADDARMDFKTRATGGSLTTRLTIADDGNVGIGTNAPAETLHIDGTARIKPGTTGYFNFEGQGNLSVRMKNSSGNMSIGGASIIFEDQNSNTARMRMYSTGGFAIGSTYHSTDPGANNVAIEGKVGIGTTAPGAKLHVYGGNIRISSTDDKPQLEFFETAAARWVIGHSNSPNNYFAISEGSDIAASERLVIAPTTGSVGIGNVEPVSPLHVQQTAGGNYTGEARIGGANTSHGMLLSYTQAGNTEGSIHVAPGYTNANALFKLRCSNGSTNQLVLKGDGKVGIGTASPDGTLHVETGSAGTITAEAYADDLIIENSDHVGISLRCPDAKDGFILFQSATNDRVARISAEYNGGDENLAFAVDDDNKMVINDSGNVGIGTTSPVAQLNLFKTGADDAISSSLYFQRAAGHYGCAILQVGNGSAGTEKLMFTAGHNNNPVAIGNAKMTIQQDGNVGIGTTSPAEILTLDSSSNTRLLMKEGGSNKGQISAGGGGLYIQNLAGDIIFRNISDADTVRIKNDGKVGIGTTTPLDKLHVQGNILQLDGSPEYHFGTTSASHRNWRVACQEDVSQGFEIASGTTSAGTGAPSDTYTNRFVIKGATGQIQFNSYGGGTHTGTSAYKLSVDAGGNIIETSIGAGAVDGSGTTNYISKWTDADTIGNSVIVESSSKIGIGTTSPAKTLELSNGTSNVAALRVARSTSLSDTYTELGTVGGSGRLEAFKGNIRIGADPDNNTSDSTIEFLTDNSVKMVIKSDGKVGIGTTAPATPLHVWSTSYPQFRVSYNSTLYFTLDHAATLNVYGNDWYVRLNSSEKFRIKQDGNVGIGTNAPGRPLEVNGTGNASVIRVGDGDTDGGAAIAYIEFGANGSSWNRHSYMGSAGADSHLWIVNEENADIKFYANNAEKMVIKNDGKVGIGSTSPVAPLDVPRASDYKVIKLGDDITSHYVMTGNSDHTLTLTCGSYYQAEIIVTAHQTNGGTYNNLYIRGIWSNNDTSHHWDEIENVGSLTNSTFTITNGQNGATANSGEWKIVHDYVSGTFVKFTVRITDFYGTHAYTIS
jgi:hypothetical protein